MALNRARGKHRAGQLSGAVPTKGGGPDEIRGRADDPDEVEIYGYAKSLPKGVDHGGSGRLLTIGSYHLQWI